MKSLLSLTLFAAFATAAVADIQSPPMAAQGPGRKFGRGISNILFGITELPCTFVAVNHKEGNSAAFAYGVHLGLARSFYRFGKGWYDVLSAPLPTYKDSYCPPYGLDLVWGHNGYAEFPPELGFETRFSYSREYNGY
jgi:putative exosortase-associated protein (TIGR04073 family)